MQPETAWKFVAVGAIIIWAGACFVAAWDTAAAEFGDSQATACSQLSPGGLCTRLPGGLLEAKVAALCHAFRETCSTHRVVTLIKHTFRLVIGDLVSDLPLKTMGIAACSVAVLASAAAAVCYSPLCKRWSGGKKGTGDLIGANASAPNQNLGTLIPYCPIDAETTFMMATPPKSAWVPLEDKLATESRHNVGVNLLKKRD